MRPDIEIARSHTLRPISQVAQKLGLGEENLEHYGRYMAKLRLPPPEPEEKRGKLILVTAINHQHRSGRCVEPAGEADSSLPA